MVPLIGNLGLYLSLIASLFALVVLQPKTSKGVYVAFWIWHFLVISIALISLIYSFIVSDFSLILVANHSHVDLPLIYKISAAWGNHEGSMLLWLLSITIFSLAFAWFSKFEITLTKRALYIQNIILLLFSTYSIFFSNPFERVFPAPVVGRGLNPLLQDIGMSFHPPILYLGYVGVSMIYSCAIACLFTPQSCNVQFAKNLKIWVFLPWAFLTLGITAGSWWAYRELGWGGYWFWDPVENASLLPWLCTTALIHALNGLQKARQMQHTIIILSILTFSLTMIGAFLVRSGIITSVHSFAVDPKRGWFILLALCLTTGGSLLLYAFKAPDLGLQQRIGKLVNTRYLGLWIAILLLISAVIVVAFGTLYPTIYGVITGRNIAIHSQYYAQLILPISYIGLVAAGFSSFMVWRPVPMFKILRQQLYTWLTSILLGGIIYLSYGTAMLSAIGATLAIYTLLATLQTYKSNRSLSMLCGHAGAAILLFAVIMNVDLRIEKEFVLEPQKAVVIGPHHVQLNRIIQGKKDNYISTSAELIVNTHGRLLTLQPELRYYPAEGTITSETAIKHYFFYDVYTAIGEYKDSKVHLRFYIEPFVIWIWIGGILISIAILGIFTRMYYARKI
jgi:cytochrome c-type biogenesis protein CcmF